MEYGKAASRTVRRRSCNLRKVRERTSGSDSTIQLSHEVRPSSPEGKMRSEAHVLVGDNVCADVLPFSFSHKDGGEVIKPAVTAYIPNLWEDLLKQNNDNKKCNYNT